MKKTFMCCYFNLPGSSKILSHNANAIINKAPTIRQRAGIYCPKK